MRRVRFRHTWGLGTTLVLVAGVLAGGYGIVSSLEHLREPALTSNDFTPDFVSARELRAGGDPYSPLDELMGRHLDPEARYLTEDAPDQANTHPPFAIVFVVPFSLLPFDIARAAWMVLGAVSTIAGMGMLLRALGVARVVAWSIAFATLALPVVRTDLRWGQWNGLTLLLIVAAWRLARTQRSATAGALIGIAAALRIFPIFLCLPLFAARRRSEVKGAILSAAAFTIAGFMVVGWGASLEFATTHSSESVEWWRPLIYNFSFISIPPKYLTGHWVGVDIGGLAHVLSAVLLLTCFTAAWRLGRRASGEDLVAPLLASIPWMLLSVPLLWEHYLVLLLPICAIGVIMWPALSTWSRLALIIASPFVFLVGEFSLSIASIGPQSSWFVLASYQLVTGAVLLLALAAGAMASAAARSGDGATSTDDPAAQGDHLAEIKG